MQQEPEALAGRRFFEAFGIAPERILSRRQSRPQHRGERAIRQGTAPADPKEQTWLLVTSAFHMPRAVGLFRKAGFPAVPWPADYLASGEEGVRIKPDQSTENIAVSNVALREWAGLLGVLPDRPDRRTVPGP